MENNKDVMKQTLGNFEDPFEVAATMFGLYKYKFETLVQNLDAKQLRLLVMGLASQPTDTVHLSPDQEIVDAYNNAKLHLQDREKMLQSLEDKATSLSTGQLRRLANAMVQYPLSDKMFVDSSSSETLKEANNIGQRMLEAKSMMFLQTVSEYEANKVQPQEQPSLVVADQNNVGNGE